MGQGRAKESLSRRDPGGGSSVQHDQAGEVMRTETGDAIVDWLFEIAENERLPDHVRRDARIKIALCAMRESCQTVEDVVGTKH